MGIFEFDNGVNNKYLRTSQERVVINGRWSFIRVKINKICRDCATKARQFVWFGENATVPTKMLHHINGLVQDCSISLVKALRILQPCTKLVMAIAWC